MRKPLNETPSVTASGALIGKPRSMPPPTAAKRIEKYAAAGYSIRSLWQVMAVSQDVLKRWLDDFPELKEAFERGREKERLALHGSLYKAATEDGNIVAAMFLLKARHGYREGEQGDAGNRVNVTFNLPGAAPLDQYIIENGNPTKPPTQPVPSTSPQRIGRT